MQPKLLYSIVCDAAARGPGGKLTLYGIFDRIIVKQLPTTYPSFTIVTSWQSGDGEYKMKIRILDPDEEKVFVSPEMPFTLRDKLAKSEMQSELSGMVFKKSGLYRVQILLEDEVKADYQFSVQAQRVPEGGSGEKKGGDS